MAKQYITPPAGLEIPPEEGEEFDVSLRVKREGVKLCVVSMNGIPMDDKEPEKEPSADERMKNMKPSEAAMESGSY